MVFSFSMVRMLLVLSAIGVSWLLTLWHSNHTARQCLLGHTANEAGFATSCTTDHRFEVFQAFLAFDSYGVHTLDTHTHTRTHADTHTHTWPGKRRKAFLNPEKSLLRKLQQAGPQALAMLDQRDNQIAILHRPEAIGGNNNPMQRADLHHYTCVDLHDQRV